MIRQIDLTRAHDAPSAVLPASASSSVGASIAMNAGSVSAPSREHGG